MMPRVTSDPLPGTILGAYRLESLLGQSALGPLFGARATQPPQAPHFVRVLAVPPITNPSSSTIFHDQFHIAASRLSTLQHPYLLPLVGYGIANAGPYLAWPAVATRSLTTRLETSGPVDVLTAGRYVDQIAAALTYAHEHATLHGSLTTDCLYLQPDGHVIVGDLGVRHLVELSAIATRTRILLGNADACAPEQTLGGPATPASDVYALAAVIYRLLTGVPIFGSGPLEVIAQRHLRSPIPPLSRLRPGLPPALDHLLATALAKDPAQRFAQPGALANAYHAIVAPTQTSRMPFVVSGAASAWPAALASNDGAPAAPPARAPVVRSPSTPSTPSWPSRAVPSGPRFAPPVALAPAAPPTTPAIPALTPGRRPRARLGRNLLFGALVLSVVVAGTFGLTHLTSLINHPSGGSGAIGVVLFMDDPQGVPGHSDAVTVVAHDLPAPPAGQFYDAWLIDSASEHVTPLGTLTPQNGTYQLNDTGDGRAGTPGTNLLAIGDRVEITLEQGHVNLPVGVIALTGAFPHEAFVHIRHLLVSFPTTPGQTALVTGVLEQTQLLDAQAKLLASAAAGHDSSAVQCAAQSLVDILEGSHGAHYHPLASACAVASITATGDGFGLLGDGGYLAEAAQHASNAAIAPDATPFIRTHAAHVEIAITNIQGWLAPVEQQALALIANPAATGAVAQLVTLTGRAHTGIDTNGDGQIDPVPGEAGAITAYEHAQLMATLDLAA